MKRIFGVVLSLVVLLIASSYVKASEMKFRGSADEVNRELSMIFPRGTEKAKVISIASDRLGVVDSSVSSHVYDDDPLVLAIDSERQLQVSSWVSFPIDEYRSIRRMFLKTVVVAKFYFDSSDRLIWHDATLYADSL